MTCLTIMMTITEVTVMTCLTIMMTITVVTVMTCLTMMMIITVITGEHTALCTLNQSMHIKPQK